MATHLGDGLLSVNCEEKRWKKTQINLWGEPSRGAHVLRGLLLRKRGSKTSKSRDSPEVGT